MAKKQQKISAIYIYDTFVALVDGNGHTDKQKLKDFFQGIGFKFFDEAPSKLQTAYRYINQNPNDYQAVDDAMEQARQLADFITNKIDHDAEHIAQYKEYLAHLNYLMAQYCLRCTFAKGNKELRDYLMRCSGGYLKKAYCFISELPNAVTAQPGIASLSLNEIYSLVKHPKRRLNYHEGESKFHLNFSDFLPSILWSLELSLKENSSQKGHEEIIGEIFKQLINSSESREELERMTKLYFKYAPQLRTESLDEINSLLRVKVVDYLKADCRSISFKEMLEACVKFKSIFEQEKEYPAFLMELFEQYHSWPSDGVSDESNIKHLVAVFDYYEKQLFSLHQLLEDESAAGVQSECALLLDYVQGGLQGLISDASAKLKSNEMAVDLLSNHSLKTVYESENKTKTVDAVIRSLEKARRKSSRAIARMIEQGNTRLQEQQCDCKLSGEKSVAENIIMLEERKKSFSHQRLLSLKVLNRLLFEIYQSYPVELLCKRLNSEKEKLLQKPEQAAQDGVKANETTYDEIKQAALLIAYLTTLKFDNSSIAQLEGLLEALKIIFERNTNYALFYKLQENVDEQILRRLYFSLIVKYEQPFKGEECLAEVIVSASPTDGCSTREVIDKVLSRYPNDKGLIIKFLSNLDHVISLRRSKQILTDNLRKLSIEDVNVVLSNLKNVSGLAMNIIAKTVLSDPELLIRIDEHFLGQASVTTVTEVLVHLLQSLQGDIGENSEITDEKLSLPQALPAKILIAKLKLSEDEQRFNQVKQELKKQQLAKCFDQCFISGLQTVDVALLYSPDQYYAAVSSIKEKESQQNILVALCAGLHCEHMEGVFERINALYSHYDFSYISGILEQLPVGVTKAQLCFYYLAHKQRLNVSGTDAVALENSAIPRVIQMLDERFEHGNAQQLAILSEQLHDTIRTVRAVPEKEKIFLAFLSATNIRVNFNADDFRLLLSEVSVTGIIQWFMGLPETLQNHYSRLFNDILNQKNDNEINKAFRMLVNEINKPGTDSKQILTNIIFNNEKLFQKAQINEREKMFKFVMLDRVCNVHAGNIELICRKIIQQKNISVEVRRELLKQALQFYFAHGIEDVRTLQMLSLAMVSMQLFSYKHGNRSINIIQLINKISDPKDRAAVLSIIFSFGTQLADATFDGYFAALIKEYLGLSQKFKPDLQQLMQIYTRNKQKPRLLAKIDEEICNEAGTQYFNKARVILRVGGPQEIGLLTKFLHSKSEGKTANKKPSLIRALMQSADYREMIKGRFFRRKTFRTKRIDQMLAQALTAQGLAYRVVEKTPMLKLFVNSIRELFSRKSVEPANFVEEEDFCHRVDLNKTTAGLLVAIVPDPVDRQLVCFGACPARDEKAGREAAQTVTISRLLDRLVEIFTMEKSAVEADQEEVKLLVDKMVAYFFECRQAGFGAEIAKFEELFALALKGYLAGYSNRHHALARERQQKNTGSSFFGKLLPRKSKRNSELVRPEVVASREFTSYLERQKNTVRSVAA